MPVQINELIIRANIVEGDGKKEGGNSPAPAASPAAGKEDIVKECVAIVMEILNNKSQR